MSDYANYFWVFLAGIQGLLMWGTQVGPKQAVSHAAEWAMTFGVKNPPSWLQSENADRFIRHIALLILIFSVCCLIAPHINLEKIQLGPKLLFGLSLAGIVGSIIWNLVAGYSPTVAISPKAEITATAPHPDLVLKVNIETRTGNTFRSRDDGSFFLTEVGSWITLQNLTKNPIAFKISKLHYVISNTVNTKPEILNNGGIVYVDEPSSFKIPAIVLPTPLHFMPGVSKFTFEGEVGFELHYGAAPGDEKNLLRYKAKLNVDVWSEGDKLNHLTTATRIDSDIKERP